jgi:hypothetical protein
MAKTQIETIYNKYCEENQEKIDADIKKLEA